VRFAQVAESAGFDQFWVSNDLFIRSAPVILTAVAAATERIEIGTCIVNPYTLHPAEMAMMTATLDEFSNGRFNLGLSSGAADFLNWVDIQPEKPRTAVVETAQAINALLSGDVADHSGHLINWSDEAYMRFEPHRRVPIYIGAMSPNMLRSIGQYADGGLPLLFPPEHYQNVMPYIKEGAETAGRSLNDVDVAACIWCSLADDADAAKDVLREKIAYYGHAFSPMILEQLNLTKDDFSRIETLIMKEKDIEAAKREVTDTMLQFGITGTSSDLIDRLESLVEMGVKHISLGPPLGPDPLAALTIIGRDVIPHFRSKIP
jgi:5,10-methylenetetrahydromethanopterin reductase